jgi:hypothetical protein
VTLGWLPGDGWGWAGCPGRLAPGWLRRDGCG